MRMQIISDYQKAKEGKWLQQIRDTSVRKLPSLILPPKWRVAGGKMSGNSLWTWRVD
jgi:hypothetical protein